MGKGEKSVYTLQAQKSNVQFLAIAYEHASECERVLNPGTSFHALVVIGEIVIPDVELLEIGHLRNSFISVSALQEIYNNTNCYKKQLAIITKVVKNNNQVPTDEGKDRHEQVRNRKPVEGVVRDHVQAGHTRTLRQRVCA